MKRQLALLAALLLAAALFANGKTTPAAPTVRLNSGYEMPVLGLGTWTLDAQTAEESVYTALKNGCTKLYDAVFVWIQARRLRIKSYESLRNVQV